MEIQDAKQARPHCELIAELLDSRQPKTEREHAAVREIERLRAELAEAKRDVDRINWMEKNKVGIYAAQSSVRATTGPRYFKPWKFCGWSAANRDDELPTVREAIDAAMAGGGHG